MEKSYVKNSTGILKKVLLCPPENIKFQPINIIAKKWIEQRKEIDKERCIKEHKELIEAYRENNVEVVLIEPTKGLTNQVFARDFGACIAEGYILGNFKESIRKKETEIYERKLKELGIPCAAKCTAGFFEGGDFWFLDDNTLIIGNIARTDKVGTKNLKKQLNLLGYELIVVECEEQYLHLDMCFNIVAEKTAVVCKEVLPYDFIKLLNLKGFTLIDIEKEDIFKHCCNLQSLGNEKVITIKNNESINKKLKAIGLKLIEVDFVELLKNGGGPHCMTFPLKRE